LLVEYGAGAGVKTRLLLDALDRPAAYVPIEISPDALAVTVEVLTDRFPELEVLPLCADYTDDHALPTPCRSARRRAAFFPGSTIGNLEPGQACAFLAHIARQVGPGGALVIGVDLRKDPAVLQPAYDDPAGITAAFNLNLLHRLQRELGARLDPDGFRHRAAYDPEAGRVEMHLESRMAQVVEVAGHPFALEAGETIHTESSYKYTVEGFTDLARRAGWRTRAVWTDPDQLFSVHQLEVLHLAG
jgi:dimethylhistidine N-methyltransferase